MLRKIIEINEDLCTGCGMCIPGCAEGALAIVDGKAKIVRDMYCDGLGACIGHCPEGALTIVEREADAFDEAAAMDHVRRMGGHVPAGHGTGGCPSSQVQFLTPCAKANVPTAQAGALSHWPVQIRLVPPHAPFLRGARLLIAGDCCPVATPAFHTEFLPGRVVLVGCPKFDDAPDYVERLTAIFQNNTIADITVLEMEVPCCSGMSRIVGQALRASGADIPWRTVVVGRDGSTSERPLEKTVL
ncbi:4Fe-4S binding protein [Desulfovibrionales bacterium]